MTSALQSKYMNQKLVFKEGYYSLLNDEELAGNNKKYGDFYDRIAWFYNLSSRIYLFFKFGGEGKARSEFLGELDIKDGDKVLEVSIGTGDNLPYLNRNAEYYGIDISKGMLKRRYTKYVTEGELP